MIGPLIFHLEVTVMFSAEFVFLFPPNYSGDVSDNDVSSHNVSRAYNLTKP
jgi:hypothetical protein